MLKPARLPISVSLLLVSLLLRCLSPAGLGVVTGELVPGFRPPATPLIALSPTISVWQRSDAITQQPPSHWIPRGHDMTMAGYLLLDDRPYRFLGADSLGQQGSASAAGGSVPAMEQIALRVQPTQTVVTLRTADRVAQLVLTFTQPALADELPQLSRPIAYITHELSILDDGAHRVRLYLDQVSDFIANELSDQVVGQDLSSAFQQHTGRSGPVAVLSQHNYGNERAHFAQPFGVSGDEVKPNWGVLYTATDSPHLASFTVANASAARQAFLASRPLPPLLVSQPRAVSDGWLASAFVFEYGEVSRSSSPLSSYLLIAHDEVLAVSYFSQYMQPLWRHAYGQSWQRLLASALQDYADLRQRADRYDAALIEAASQVSDEYATLCALVHRQVLSMLVLVWDERLQAERAFMLEPSTSGATSTIDVIFPASPFLPAPRPRPAAPAAAACARLGQQPDPDQLDAALRASHSRLLADRQRLPGSGSWTTSTPCLWRRQRTPCSCSPRWP